MSETVGDKIGLTVPTDLGDNNTWGGILNALFAVIDELTYASREDRNLSIIGGGTISWDATAGEVSFTENIVIRDHITDKTVTITTAASPITLTANQVAYVAKNRNPASNQSITSATVVSAGSLPNDTTDGNMGVIVLFMRTSNDTLNIPFFRREIIGSDSWSIGMAQTLFERQASARKPAYSIASTGTTVTVAAGSSVIIDGKLYYNSAAEDCNLSTAGRGGLDTGSSVANTPYYLYAIPAVSGRGFDLVASATAPTTGPTGFSSWSYVGACLTASSSGAFDIFTAVGGFLTCTVGLHSASHTGNTTRTDKQLICPTTAINRFVRMQLDVSATLSGTSNRFNAVDVAGSAVLLVAPRVSSTHFEWGWVPHLDPQVIWIQCARSDYTVTARLYGWQEDPMEYK